jgi:hypothetical protein
MIVPVFAILEMRLDEMLALEQFALLTVQQYSFALV